MFSSRKNSTSGSIFANSSGFAETPLRNIWKYKINGDVWSSPAIIDDKVYIGSFNHNVYCLDVINGSYIWNYNTKDLVRSSPAVADGKIYFGTYSPGWTYEGNVFIS